ncbi:solute carrier family 22 member 6 isoform X1 [Procambarus clarkii]|uniref:solute carrier family 22 member 6 isoform X1 n=2 Tax=Procambarus clarkii TaxID=6728 RepID=UPI001E6708FA|nr:solute carrier family 22 member 6-like [Procambarus clarkii]XP_045606661.1 solute carrier family 22 member 6-like [Procambarus clarkii]
MSDDDGFDHFLTKLGFGRWQIITLATTFMIVMVLPVHLIGSPLVSAPVAFRCFTDAQSSDGAPHSLPYREGNDSSNSSQVYYNSQCLEPHNLSVTLEASDIPRGSARHKTSMSSCPIIEYDTSVFSSTVVSEYDLVCEDLPLQPFYQMMFNVGGILGSFIGGHIGDRWGRRKAVQIGCIANILSVLGTALVPVYPFILVMRIITGCACVGTLIPAWNLVLESTPSKRRSLVGMLSGLPYSVCVGAFAGVAYCIRTWRYLLLVCSSPVLILIPLSFIVDESPRWLVQQGRAEEATTVLQKAVRLNNVKLSENVYSIVNNIIEASKRKNRVESEAPTSSGLVEVFRQLSLYVRSPSMRTILLATSLLWFLQSGLYLGVAINANNFTSTDPFLYVALTGLMDGIAILVTTPVTPYLGRRTIVGLGLFGGGVLLFLDLLVSTDYYWAKWILVMAGFLMVAGAFQVNFVFAPELFPTEARTRGFAFVNMMGSIGFMFAPLVTTMVARYAWWAAGVTFGCSGIVGSFMVIFLPETNNQPLPETLQDVEDRARRSRQRGVANKAFENGETVI